MTIDKWAESTYFDSDSEDHDEQEIVTSITEKKFEKQSDAQLNSTIIVHTSVEEIECSTNKQSLQLNLG